jgi:uncharacterized membrane protein
VSKRHLAALFALVGALVASYLTLYKMGIIGQLACSVGSCETVNTSRWAMFVGAPVAAWGVAFYLAVFVIAVAGTTERFVDSRRVSLILLLLTGWGVAFSAWLTYLELAVIHAICVYCVTSAVIVTILFVLCVLDYHSRRPRMSEGH